MERGTQQCRPDADDERPPELRHRQLGHRRQVGHRQRRLRQAGDRVQTAEEQGSEAGGQQSGDEEHRRPSRARARDLHQQERAEQRGAEQRADGGEASRRPDQCHGSVGSVTVERAHRPGRESTAERDQRCFGAQHRSERQRAQRREHDAGQVPRPRWTSGVETVHRGFPARAGEVADHEPYRQSPDRHHRQRPPCRCSVETERVRQVVEQPVPRVQRELEEPVRHQRDGQAERPRQHQRLQIVAGAQQLQRASWRALPVGRTLRWCPFRTRFAAHASSVRSFGGECRGFELVAASTSAATDALPEPRDVRRLDRQNATGVSTMITSAHGRGRPTAREGTRWHCR